MRQIKHRQHASRLPNGLGRSSCEGIVRPCWILAAEIEKVSLSSNLTLELDTFCLTVTLLTFDFEKLANLNFVNSLAAMDGHNRPLFYELLW